MALVVEEIGEMTRVKVNPSVNEDNLRTLETNVNAELTEFVSTVSNCAESFKETFNATWASGAAQNLANEIATCLNSAETALQKYLEYEEGNLNEDIRDINTVEEVNVGTVSFNLEPVQIEIALNDKLPNGSYGVREDAEWDELAVPMKEVVSNVNNHLDAILTAIKTSDAFDSDGIAVLASDFSTHVKTPFANSMAELEKSLDTRLEGEEGGRELLARRRASRGY